MNEGSEQTRDAGQKIAQQAVTVDCRQVWSSCVSVSVNMQLYVL